MLQKLEADQGVPLLSIADVLLMCMCADVPVAAWGLGQHHSFLEVEQTRHHKSKLFHGCEGESVQSVYPPLGHHRH